MSMMKVVGNVIQYICRIMFFGRFCDVVLRDKIEIRVNVMMVVLNFVLCLLRKGFMIFFRDKSFFCFFGLFFCCFVVFFVLGMLGFIGFLFFVFFGSLCILILIGIRDLLVKMIYSRKGKSMIVVMIIGIIILVVQLMKCILKVLVKIKFVGLDDMRIVEVILVMVN